MVIPIGPPGGFFYGQELFVVEKRNGHMIKRRVTEVAFVPLRGRYGWS